MSFKEGIEPAKIKNLVDETEQNVRNFEDVTSKVVEEYTSELDSILNAIKINIVSVEDPATETLEKYLLELTNAAYFVGAKVDTLSMYAAMSKAAYKEAYNDAYLGNQVKDAEKKNKTTVAENQAVAEKATIYESAITDVYSTAYSIVKNKLTYAQLMISAISKSISRRMSEMQLSGVYTSGRKILNETWQDQGY